MQSDAERHLANVLQKRTEAAQEVPPEDRKESRSRYRKESAIIGQAQLRKQRGKVEQISAGVVLILSALGTIVAFHGSWAALFTHFSWAALSGGILIQVVLTYLEWHYYDQFYVSWSARGLDTYLTALGFGPLFVPWITEQLTARAVPQSFYSAWAIVAAVSLLIAWWPESRLID